MSLRISIWPINLVQYGGFQLRFCTFGWNFSIRRRFSDSFPTAWHLGGLLPFYLNVCWFHWSHDISLKAQYCVWLLIAVRWHRVSSPFCRCSIPLSGSTSTSLYYQQAGLIYWPASHLTSSAFSTLPMPSCLLIPASTSTRYILLRLPLLVLSCLCFFKVDTNSISQEEQ